MQTDYFDYLVIGAGSGGVRSARIAAQHGAKVAIIEKNHLGGTCVNVGCVPKKLYSYAADYGYALEDMEAYGWSTRGAHFDWATLLEHKNAEIARLNGIYQSLLEKAGVHLFRGTGKFIDSQSVEINNEYTLKADKILIATGGKPRRPIYPGSEHALISDDLFYHHDFPEHIVIQGGGYIGVEFAHIFHGLGAKVSLLHRGDLWLRGFDTDLRLFLKEEYLKAGVDVRFNSDIQSIQTGQGHYIVQTTDGETLACDLILSAIGRQPNIEELELNACAIELDPQGRIKVNENWQTNQPHIYAIGDVSNAHNLTPYAIAEGHILADRLFQPHKDPRHVNLSLIPTAIFSTPPIGTVGLSEEQAGQEGYDFEIYTSAFRPLRHTLTGREEKTFIKLLVEKPSQKIIGCHIAGADAPEIIQGIAIAMNAGATKDDFDRTIGVHPTSAEELVTLSDPQPAKIHGGC